MSTGAVDARWIVALLVVVVVVAPQGDHFGLIVLRRTASLFRHYSSANIATELSFGPTDTKFRVDT